MTDILDLPGWTVLEKSHSGGEYEITIEYTKHPDACQKCGVVGRVYRHGPKVVTYRDCPAWGKSVRLTAKLQRYKCRECGGTFLQPVEGMDDARRMTSRCVEHIQEAALMESFSAIANRVGCVEGTVRNIAQDFIQRLANGYRPPKAAWLGIDEVMISKSLRCVITDVVNRVPVDMLKDRNKPTVTAWLRSYPYKSEVQGVATDMWKPYREAVHNELPGVPVVVDKFHVVAMVSRGLETVRRGMRASISDKMRRHLMRSRFLMLKRPDSLNAQDRFSLQMMLDNAPDLKAAYELKEEFADIYDMSKDDAIEAFKAWPARVPEHLRPSFKEILTAMKNWETEILAFFDHRITNGYTEAVNGVAKVINRAGRGYSFDVLRAKILHRNRLPDNLSPKSVDGMGRMKEGHEILVGVAGGRCECCAWECGPRLLRLGEIPPFMPGQHWKRGYLCPHCYKRFHTDGTSGHESDSTR